MRKNKPNPQVRGLEISTQRVHFVFAISLMLVASLFAPAAASAQSNAQLCGALNEQLTQSLNANSTKSIISLERQFLTYCKEYLQADRFAQELAVLATALNRDNQHQDALGIANTCLQLDTTELACRAAKAEALSSFGRLREAKSLIESSLTLGAITEFDAAAKRYLRTLLLQVNAALAPQETEGDIPQHHGAHAGPAIVEGRVVCEGSAVALSMSIDGDIDSSTVESVKTLFAQYDAQTAKVNAGYNCPRASDNKMDPALLGREYHQINSRGGSIDAAMAIGRMFRKEHALLAVMDDCISACVLIMAGAVDRMTGETSVIGIHRPYLGTSPQNPLRPQQVKEAYEHMLQDMRDYLREMNVSERLADDMLAIEPERIRILTQAERAEYELARVDPAEQQRRAIANEARDVEEANRLGLDRLEYTRRKALADSICAYAIARNDPDYVEFSKCKQRVLKTGAR